MKDTPVMLTWSPGRVHLVVSPRQITVKLLGMFPTGTWSLCINKKILIKLLS